MISIKELELVSANQLPDLVVLEKENEPEFRIEVARNQFVGTRNQFGRRQTEVIEVQTFNNYSDAFEWALKGQKQGFNHHFKIPIPFPISASLDRTFPGERLVVKCGEVAGKSPRTVVDHHSVSTDRHFFKDICAKGCGVLFDRGIAWVDVYDEQTPFLKFNLLGERLVTQEELKTGIESLAQRVTMVMRDLLLGMDNGDQKVPSEKVVLVQL